MSILIVCWIGFGWWIWFVNLKHIVKNSIPNHDWWWDVVAYLAALCLLILISPFLYLWVMYVEHKSEHSSYSTSEA